MDIAEQFDGLVKCWAMGDDEPAGLDADGMKRLAAYMKQLKKDSGLVRGIRWLLASEEIRMPDEVQRRLDDLLKDDRLRQRPATIEVNAPLAMEQLRLETEIEVLRWVLNQ